MSPYIIKIHSNMIQRNHAAQVKFLIALFFLAVNAKKYKEYSYPSPCGDGHGLTIKYPFRFNFSPINEGDPQYELGCEANHTVLYFGSNKYYVKAISYENQTIRIVDTALSQDNCSSLPRNFLSWDYYDRSVTYIIIQQKTMVLMDCANAIDNDSYVDCTPCINSSDSQRHAYALVTADKPQTVLGISCKFVAGVPTQLREVGNRSFSDIHNELMMGFEISWISYKCWNCDHGVENCTLRCSFTQQVPFGRRFSMFQNFLQRTPRKLLYMIIVLGCIMVGRILCGIIFALAALTYKLRRRHISMDYTIEEFLHHYKSVTPTRYSYSNIKKMTNGFKEKLGQGGFGSVFKGKLPNGRLVAVKMLGKSESNGQDFINEVATIGMIHHANVVKLIGFCFEGSKWALIYDFMPNGSLDKYIFPQEGKGSSLSWEKISEIALGVACGIEYLHRGCTMKILHFDIKPHNILLDKNFIPKISDFGLAKFYPVDESIVSVTAARGTIGYMAPELFYRNIGGVSYKSDVYSFGMLLLEMVGRRRNADAMIANSSQIYFPSWVYDQLIYGRETYMENATDDEKEIARKITMVALWCIQMRPIDRPSMSKVVEMLEGPIELLQMPPKPFLSAPQSQVSTEDHVTSNNLACPEGEFV